MLPKQLSFAADSLPLAVIVAAKVGDVSVAIDSSLPSGSAPSFLFPNGEKLHGSNVLLRYIARVANLPNLYGLSVFESGQIDQWLEYAPTLSLGSEFKNACKYINEYLQRQTLIVGNGLSIADIAIWIWLAMGEFEEIKEVPRTCKVV